MKAKIGNRLLDSLKTEAKAYEVCDTELAGFMVRVQPSGAMTYICSYRLKDGRRQRMTLGRTSLFTPTQARDWAFSIMADVRKGLDPASSRKTAKAESLLIFLDEIYGPWVSAHRKRGKETLKRLKSYFSDFLRKPICEITPWAIEKWRTQKRKDGLKPISVNRELSALRSALSKAVEWGLIETHPLAKVKPFKTDKKGIVRYLSEEEEGRLRIALDDREEKLRVARDSANEWRRIRDYPEYPNLRSQYFADYLKPLVILSINTGLRRGELLSLSWRNVDFTRSVLTVAGTAAKSGSTRHIPLNKEARLLLGEWKHQHPTLPDAFLFTNGSGERLGELRKSWHSLLARAKIENFRWHDLRHHFASKLVMAGVDLNTVRELLGHADITMTLRYAHLAPHITAAAVEKIQWQPKPLQALEPTCAEA